MPDFNSSRTGRGEQIMKTDSRVVVLVFTLSFVALCIAGCASPPGFSGHKTMRKLYVKTHKERPAGILDAVLEGKMTPGMTAREAKLCWGSPTRIEPYGSGSQAGEVWVYEETRSGGSSTLYDITVTRSRLTMTNGPAGPLVAHWILY
jgi:hypothetical protein